MKNVKVYGADWCSDCVTAKKFLESKKIDFEYIDITKDELAVRFVENVNDGKRIIPTLVIDGKTHTNPGIAGLIRLFNSKRVAQGHSFLFSSKTHVFCCALFVALRTLLCLL